MFFFFCMQDLIDEWREVRAKTYEFLEGLPQERMAWRPHEILGTFGMQLRHMIVSERAYIEGLLSGTISFDEKGYDEAWETRKEAAIEQLREMDKRLLAALSSAKEEIVFDDGVFGKVTVDPATVLRWLIQHETYHQGIFTCYGRLTGMGKFRFM